MRRLEFLYGVRGEGLQGQDLLDEFQEGWRDYAGAADEGEQAEHGDSQELAYEWPVRGSSNDSYAYG